MCFKPDRRPSSGAWRLTAHFLGVRTRAAFHTVPHSNSREVHARPCLSGHLQQAVAAAARALEVAATPPAPAS